MPPRTMTAASTISNSPSKDIDRSRAFYGVQIPIDAGRHSDLMSDTVPI